jgi:cobyrinic acid a,c-diamide synthase
VVAGTSSGVGKTTVATGLLAALRHAGHGVTSAKVGPDFIDPGYHALASGGQPRNLDAWICGPDAIAPLAGRAAAGGDVLVVEGVMGLFDGAADGTPSSTADVARLLDAPVLLVVDASAMAGSVAALVHGFATLDRSVRVAGVVLNRVASDGHATMLREALAPLGIAVVGELRRDDRLVWRDRHLGLVPVLEDRAAAAAALGPLAAAITARFDLDATMAIARAAPARAVAAVAVPPPGRSVRRAVAAGPAFTFLYADTVDALVAAGAELVEFDPLADPALPDALDGLVVGGGFPEAHAAALTDNHRLLADVRRRVGDGLVTWAECGGLLWLARSLDGAPMAGVLPTRAVMAPTLTLGYRQATTAVASPLGVAGTTFRGHEFHYSALDEPGSDLALTSRFGSGRAGFLTSTLAATYVHHHPGGDPRVVGAFVEACRRAQ